VQPFNEEEVVLTSITSLASRMRKWNVRIVTYSDEPYTAPTSRVNLQRLKNPMMHLARHIRYFIEATSIGSFGILPMEVASMKNLLYAT
jgi:hypothetical protein